MTRDAASIMTRNGARTTTQYAIVGVTLTGNKGGTSMLYAALDCLRSDDPSQPARFDLLSVYPRQDREANTLEDLRIVSAPAWSLVLVHLPLAVLLWPLARIGWGRRLLSISPIFRALLQADAVIDLAGISFVDHRGLAVLAYNTACTLPATLFGRRVFKLSQAVGPFQTRLNRLLAKAVLPRCETVIARGSISCRNLQAILGEKARELPDTAFAMQVPETLRTQVADLCRARGIRDDRELLIISPSHVVLDYCRGKSIDYCGELAAFVAKALEAGIQTVLLPHSTVEGKSKNNDITVCREVFAKARSLVTHPEAAELFLLEDDFDARLLRALIGRADYFIGSRFHSMVSALSMCVPCLIIGWSHKYREVMQQFAQERWCLDWSDVGAERLWSLFEQLRAEAETARQGMLLKLPSVQQQARENFQLVRERLAG